MDLNFNKKNVNNNSGANPSKVDIAFDKIKDERYVPETITEGNVSYLDASELNRPESLKIDQNKKAKKIVMLSVLISLIILVIYIFSTFGNMLLPDNKSIEIAKQNVSYDIPQLPPLLGLSKDQTESVFTNQGFNMLDIKSDNEGSSEFKMFKVPATCDIKEATNMLTKEIDKLNATEFAKLFNGGWEFTSGLSAGKNFIRVRYADFKAQSLEGATESAKQTQTISDMYMTDSGKDDIGNTFQTGTGKIDEQAISWRISAVPLSEVYKLNLPENSVYVGIRIEQIN